MNSISDLVNHGLRLSMMRNVLKSAVYAPCSVTLACRPVGSHSVSAPESAAEEGKILIHLVLCRLQ